MDPTSAASAVLLSDISSNDYSQIGVSSPVKRSAVTQEIELETQPSLISQADSPHKVKRQRLADPDPPSVATVMNEADHPPANAGIAPPAQVVETGKEEAKTEGSGSATTDTASLSPMELDSASPVQDIASKVSSIVGLDESAMSDPVIDKILGCIYGNALGDAYGLATEFIDADTIRRMYPNASQPIPFPNYKLTGHNARTDDTDQMICILDTLLETDGSVDILLFAKKLLHWSQHGFPEGDKCGMGLGATVGAVLRHPKFLVDPHTAASEVWTHTGRRIAANGAVMRTSILGCWKYKDLTAVTDNTEAIARVTHADPRCIASCIIVTTAIARVLQGAACSTPEEIESIIADALQRGMEAAKRAEISSEHEIECRQYVAMRELKEMGLDGKHQIGYTLKCMASGLFGLRSQQDFQTTLDALIREGGDADTNGAVCGALLGCKLGYRKLPMNMLAAMPHKSWLDAKVVKFLQLMKAGSSA